MDDTDRVRRDRLRSDCYRLLSACFYPPEPARLLEEGTFLDLVEALDQLYPDAGAAAHATVLHEQLTQLGERELRVDHAALFLGPFTLKAPPYGSVYLEPGHRLMGETTLAAAARYVEAGLTLTLHEPADHIAVELEFMHYLASLAVQAARRGDSEEAVGLAEGQRRFLGDHLGAWAPVFCAAIRRGAETRFYRALADCLQAFVEAEADQQAADWVARAGYGIAPQAPALSLGSGHSA